MSKLYDYLKFRLSTAEKVLKDVKLGTETELEYKAIVSELRYILTVADDIQSEDFIISELNEDE